MSNKKPFSRPRGKVSKKEMEGYINENNWALYKNELIDWCEENDVDHGLQKVHDADTRGHPRKYVRADVMLEWWKKVKQNQAIPPSKWRSIKRRLEKFAREVKK